jgi:hypothetical protein
LLVYIYVLFYVLRVKRDIQMLVWNEYWVW